VFLVTPPLWQASFGFDGNMCCSRLFAVSCALARLCCFADF
jgi:hypothetical protein